MSVKKKEYANEITQERPHSRRPACPRHKKRPGTIHFIMVCECVVCTITKLLCMANSRNCIPLSFFHHLNIALKRLYMRTTNSRISTLRSGSLLYFKRFYTIKYSKGLDQTLRTHPVSAPSSHNASQMF